MPNRLPDPLDSLGLDPLHLAVFRPSSFYEIMPPRNLLGSEWHWHLKGSNGEIMMQGEGHPTEALCRAAIERIRKAASTTDIRVVK